MASHTNNNHRYNRGSNASGSQENRYANNSNNISTNTTKYSSSNYDRRSYAKSTYSNEDEKMRRPFPQRNEYNYSSSGPQNNGQNVGARRNSENRNRPDSGRHTDSMGSFDPPNRQGAYDKNTDNYTRNKVPYFQTKSHPIGLQQDFGSKNNYNNRKGDYAKHDDSRSHDTYKRPYNKCRSNYATQNGGYRSPTKSFPQKQDQSSPSSVDPSSSSRMARSQIHTDENFSTRMRDRSPPPGPRPDRYEAHSTSEVGESRRRSRSRSVESNRGRNLHESKRRKVNYSVANSDDYESRTSGRDRALESRGRSQAWSKRRSSISRSRSRSPSKNTRRNNKTNRSENKRRRSYTRSRSRSISKSRSPRKYRGSFSKSNSHSRSRSRSRSRSISPKRSYKSERKDSYRNDLPESLGRKQNYRSTYNDQQPPTDRYNTWRSQPLQQKRSFSQARSTSTFVPPPYLRDRERERNLDRGRVRDRDYERGYERELDRDQEELRENQSRFNSPSQSPLSPMSISSFGSNVPENSTTLDNSIRRLPSISLSPQAPPEESQKIIDEKPPNAPRIMFSITTSKQPISMSLAKPSRHRPKSNACYLGDDEDEKAPSEIVEEAAQETAKEELQKSSHQQSEPVPTVPEVVEPREMLEVYDRIAQVGEGTYGKVYKAKHVETGSLVALKRIRMEAEKDGFPVTALREIKLLQNLKHENVVDLLEMVISRGHVYMVLNYMDHDLTGVLHNPNIVFTGGHLKSLMSQLLSGLGYIHTQGILHRDLKGSNILLSKEGTLKIADFGLARFFRSGREDDYTNRVITQWYKPPELLFGETRYGVAIDMWSAGCIYLELYKKRPIFQGQDEIHQLDVIFQLMGTPSAAAWPGLIDLPWYELVKPQKEIPSQFAETYHDILSVEGMNLAKALLELDPSKRPSCEQALNMDFFTTELPFLERPAILADVEGEWHEYESKRARKKK